MEQRGMQRVGATLDEGLGGAKDAAIACDLGERGGRAALQRGPCAANGGAVRFSDLVNRALAPCLVRFLRNAARRTRVPPAPGG